jgi:hypothetical protein
MKVYKKAISNCIRKLADQIDKMPASFLEELADGNFNVKIEQVTNKKKIKIKQVNKILDNYELNQIESALRGMKSREDGALFLSEKKFNKNGLVTLAKHLDLPVQQRDNMKHISEKIIETTIGYRLDSQAIRGYRNNEISITNKPS